MAPREKTTNAKSDKRPIEQYDHKGKTRVNNPPVGLVTPKTDPLATRVAVKVIDDRGIESLKVVSLD